MHHAETQLYYLQSRYYDPKLGRFLNADALVRTGQGVLGNNMFAYCGNNPVNGCDPCGTCFHRWDFWNDCESCGGKNLDEKVYDTIVTNILPTINQSGPNSKNTISFVIETMSFFQSNSFKSLYGVYQLGSGLNDFAEGIVLLVGPFPSPLDDFIGLYKMGNGGISMSEGLVDILEVGLDEMCS